MVFETLLGAGIIGYFSLVLLYSEMRKNAMHARVNPADRRIYLNVRRSARHRPSKRR